MRRSERLKKKDRVNYNEQSDEESLSTESEHLNSSDEENQFTDFEPCRLKASDEEDLSTEFNRVATLFRGVFFRIFRRI